LVSTSHPRNIEQHKLIRKENIERKEVEPLEDTQDPSKNERRNQERRRNKTRGAPL
jgi:hypothetical protein